MSSIKGNGRQPIQHNPYIAFRSAVHVDIVVDQNCEYVRLPGMSPEKAAGTDNLGNKKIAYQSIFTSLKIINQPIVNCVRINSPSFNNARRQA